MGELAQDIADYERWLRTQCAVVEADLQVKHERMRRSPFDFLRATYFRWARTIEALCPGLAGAPGVLAVGDIHLENYGTWRDADARLVWGINDFDEAATMPYAFDLVRLATSALLAPKFETDARTVVDAVLEGYRAGLAQPRAVLLDADAGWLRAFADPTADDNAGFWQELHACADTRPPRTLQQALRASLPPGARVQRWIARRKGGGSLGRPRIAAIAEWQSGHVLREAKALVPSAWLWAHGRRGRSRSLDVAYGRWRAPDPHLNIVEKWILRRIAPDARKIELKDVHGRGLGADLLAAMAADLAAVHAAAPAAAARVGRDLAARPRRWLRDAAETACAAVRRDYAAYAAG